MYSSINSPKIYYLYSANGMYGAVQKAASCSKELTISTKGNNRARGLGDWQEYEGKIFSRSVQSDHVHIAEGHIAFGSPGLTVVCQQQQS